MPTEYEIHPAANIFPMMTEAEYQGLREDIREHGQKDWACTLDGKLLDGRNRYRACQELGIELECCELESGTDPVDYVLSKNLHRRHLSQSQRAQCAADVARLRKGSNQHTSKDGCSIDDAAKAFSVSRPSVERAKHVADKGDRVVVDAVKSDEISVSLAAQLVDAVPDKKEQKRIVKEGKKAVKAAVKASKPKSKQRKKSTDEDESAQDQPGAAEDVQEAETAGPPTDRIAWVVDRVGQLWGVYCELFGDRAERHAFVAGLENWQVRSA